jgi:hypothetical protein
MKQAAGADKVRSRRSYPSIDGENALDHQHIGIAAARGVRSVIYLESKLVGLAAVLEELQMGRGVSVIVRVLRGEMFWT